jgi:NTE family protein
LSSDLALVMGGGGARAAYQVGLLRALARNHPQLEVPILTGVSAGAINTAFLANETSDFAEKVERLAELWGAITTDDVFASNASSLLTTAARWAVRLVSGGSKLAPPTRGMVDTAPLREFLCRTTGSTDGTLPGIARNVAAGKVRAVGLTTTDYATNQTVTYVQGKDVEPWTRPNRLAVDTRLTVDHIMASAALPLFFPAIKVGERWHGDGGIRLTSPLAPALHLGAGRILALSTRYQKRGHEVDRPTIYGYPPPAQVIGTLMNAVFLDALDYDALMMGRINDLLRELPEQKRGGLRVAELMILRPSRDLARLATKYEPRLPQPFRFLTRGLGTRETRSPDSLSMVMFQPDYMKHLMSLAETDAEQRRGEIDAFLAGEPMPMVQETSFWRL